MKLRPESRRLPAFGALILAWIRAADERLESSVCGLCDVAFIAAQGTGESLVLEGRRKHWQGDCIFFITSLFSFPSVQSHRCLPGRLLTTANALAQLCQLFASISAVGVLAHRAN